MARIGVNARLVPVMAVRWLVVWMQKGRVPQVNGNGGHLGFWSVRESPVNLKRENPPPYHFRVQRDAVMFAQMMNLRAP
jgi:hypothetical protein